MKFISIILLLCVDGLLAKIIIVDEKFDTVAAVQEYDLIPQYDRILIDTVAVEKPDFGISVGCSFSFLDTSFYLSFQPFFKYKNLSVGLDLLGQISNDYQFRIEDLDDIFDYPDKIKFLDYSTKNKLFNLHFGSIENLTFGHGHLINGYSNQIYYPYKQKSGGTAVINFGHRFVSIHTFISNFGDLKYNGSLVGFRSTLIVSDNFPLKIGVNLVSDINQYASLSDSTISKWNKENSRQFTGISFDFQYNLIKMYDYEVNIYAEGVGLLHPENRHFVRDIKETSRQGSWGMVFPGFHFMHKKSIEFKIEYQLNSSLFIPSYFNSLYDLERVRYIDSNQSYADTLNWEDISQYDLYSPSDSTTLIPKDLYYSLRYGTFLYPTSGFRFSIDADISYIGNIETSYTYLQDIGADESKRYHTFSFRFIVNDQVIIGVSGAEFYYENHFDDKVIRFSDFRENSTFGFDLKFKPTKYFSIVCGAKSVFYDSDFDLNIDHLLDLHIVLGYSFD